MALSVKDPETDRLARELARLTDEKLTVAIRRSIEERLDRVRAKQAVANRSTEIEAIIERGRARPLLDQRTPDEILGYDDVGLPG